MHGGGAYATEMLTYDYRQARKLRTVALHRYGADIRPQACMEAAPLWSYATEMQTYDHMHAWKLPHCGVTPLWCRHTTTGMHEGCATMALCRCGADIWL